MKKLRVCKEFTFAAAHQLPNYDGPCRNLHGHEWSLEVEVIGEIQSTDMVLDFTVLKATIKEKLIDNLDHQYLNDIWSNPTAETMVDNFVDIIKCALMEKAPWAKLSKIRLYETPTSYCEWRREDG